MTLISFFSFLFSLRFNPSLHLLGSDSYYLHCSASYSLRLNFPSSLSGGSPIQALADTLLWRSRSSLNFSSALVSHRRRFLPLVFLGLYNLFGFRFILGIVGFGFMISASFLFLGCYVFHLIIVDCLTGVLLLSSAFQFDLVWRRIHALLAEK